MQWLAYHGDLLDVPADVLVCSANVFLTMSGGVGGAFLLRHGDAMQQELQKYLAVRNLRHVTRGEVIAMPPCGSPYRAVLHAVAVDGFYDSSPAIIAEVIQASLYNASTLGANTVALAALATGYGRLTMQEFAVALRQLGNREYPPLEKVTIGLRSRSDLEELLALVPWIKEPEDRTWQFLRDHR
jgi:O-acetyl-ADP-ribose deacetylase (regulator of RNase III)